MPKYAYVGFARHVLLSYHVRMEKYSAASVMSDLKKHASLSKAAASKRFFKTGPGQYGHGDRFIGVTVPEQRLVARRYRRLPLSEIKKLLVSPVHEHRLTGLVILVGSFTRADLAARERIAKFYLANARRANNWDLVDSSASYILGEYLRGKNRKERSVLYSLVTSENIWERRIAVIATHALIKDGDFFDALKIAELLLADDHDLIHKAVGWTLREVGKRSPAVLKKFLRAHAKTMPRISLRYALEKFAPDERKKYMTLEHVFSQ